MSISKRYKENLEKIDINKDYLLDDAIEILSTSNKVKFDESVDLAINLGVDPKHADQIVRGIVSLPHGTGKKLKVLVIAKGDKADEAISAGADFAGDKEYLDKIKSGWVDIDVIIATPDMMAEVGKLGRVLGPRKLMPNPKSGTVTNDVAKAIKELKAGKLDARVEKNGILQSSIGKTSFSEQELKDNFETLRSALMSAKPNSFKGKYLNSISISSTLGPGINIGTE